jgi:hypothetical protein
MQFIFLTGFVNYHTRQFKYDCPVQPEAKRKDEEYQLLGYNTV